MAITYVTKLAVFLLWAAALFDPTGSLFNLKYIGLAFFAFALLLNISTNQISFRARDPSIVFFLIFFIFLQSYGLLVGAIRGGLTKEFIDTSYIFSAAFFSFILLIIKKESFDYSIKTLLLFSSAIGSLIISAYAFTLFDLAHWNYFFLEKGLAYISERNYGGITLPYIYFIVSPILVFAICKSTDDVVRKFSPLRLGKLIFFVISLSLTGTRMNIVFSFISVLLTFFWLRFGRTGYLYLSFLFLIALFALIFADIGVVNSFLDSSEANNNTKLGYLPYYWAELNSPLTLLFGQGFNAHTWSNELQTLLAPGASKLELTYLELIRIFGVPLGVGFIATIFWFLFSTARTDPNSSNWIQPASLSYVLMATLNPYLFSLDGMMVLATALAYRHHARRAQPFKRTEPSLRSTVTSDPPGTLSA